MILRIIFAIVDIINFEDKSSKSFGHCKIFLLNTGLFFYPELIFTGKLYGGNSLNTKGV
jgi:hypothetical protein